MQARSTHQVVDLLQREAHLDADRVGRVEARAHRRVVAAEQLGHEAELVRVRA